MDVKENNFLVNALIFVIVIVLLVPYNSLFGDIRFIPLYDLGVVKIYIGLIMVLFMYVRFLHKSNIFNKDLLNLLHNTGAFYYITGLVLATIATMNLVNIMTVIFAISFIMAGVIFYVVSRNFAIERSLKWALLTCTIYGFFVCIVEYFYYGNARPAGLMGNANVWSAYLAFVLPLCIYELKNAQLKYLQVFYAVLSISIVSCMVLAKSRAMLVAFIFAGFLYLLKKLYSYKKSFVYIVLLALIIACVIAFPKLQQLLMSRSYDKDRLNAYITAVKMFCDHPLIGVGYAMFKEEYALEYTPMPNIEILPHAHCLYLQYLATTGIIGFVGLVCFIGKFMKSLHTRAKSNSYYYCGLFGMSLFLGHGIFDSSISNLFFFRVFWFFFAIYNIDIFARDKIVED